MLSDYSQSVNRVSEIQKIIQDIHPFLQRLFPIAVAEQGQFLVYQPDPAGSYRLVETMQTPMPIPVGIRAAFPLDSDGSRMACVVTGEIFGALDGYVTIFHEFIHCQQYEMCEIPLKQSLAVFREAQAKNDFMWEINHPFPYDNQQFVSYYASFLELEPESQRDVVWAIREKLGACLNQVDFEYMVWQEWKEGFARRIENQIRFKLGLPENQGGKTSPFNRVSFYVGGEKFIGFITKQDSSLILDIELLFIRMQQAK